MDNSKEEEKQVGNVEEKNGLVLLWTTTKGPLLLRTPHPPLPPLRYLLVVGRCIATLFFRDDDHPFSGKRTVVVSKALAIVWFFMSLLFNDTRA
jgi:hypothetical protein